MPANDSLPRAPAGVRDCFHCGLPVPAGAIFGHAAGGGDGLRSFCCAGCEAVSLSISGLGLDDYYRLRAQPGPRPAEGEQEALGAFDDPLVQAGFVRATGQGECEAQLLLEGLRCGACAWLVEQVVRRIPGVVDIDLNYATRRARLRWRPAATRLSAVLDAVRGLGYAAWPYEVGRLALIEQGEKRSLMRRLWVAGLAMMQVMMYAVPSYLALDGEMTADAESLMRWAGLVLTLPVMAYSAAPFLAGAFRDLRLARLGMDIPVSVGLLAAFAASAVATWAGRGQVYFDSVTMFVFLLLGGRYLEMLARQRAGSSLEHLARLVPQTAHRLEPGGPEALARVPVARLAAGERVLVKPGEAVPADGTLESATAELDEAWLSGESRALPRVKGDQVYGGSVNAGGAFVMRVTRVGGDTALSSIHRLMERALAERPRWIEAAQRASGLFVGMILAAALAAGLAWLVIDPARALWVAVSVLIVTCPCALALATPVVVTAATGALARVHLVAARGHVIERLAAATDFVFDKTGTLTHGAPRLLDTMPLGNVPAPACVDTAAALARCSSHPLDRALKMVSETNFPKLVSETNCHAGCGIEACVDGIRVRMGKASFVAALVGRPAPVAWIRSKDSVVYLGDERGWIAAFRIGDTLRDNARASLEQLKALGLRVHLLSGDEAGVVESVAAQLGITDCHARATPQSKLAVVRELQSRGARVAMVGDGINDAPVLAQADVSIAMGGGADLARAQADAVLLSDSLSDLARAVAIARRARRILRQNLSWALGYNLIAIPLALTGQVTPLIAGIGMAASSLVVVANAARVRS